MTTASAGKPRNGMEVRLTSLKSGWDKHFSGKSMLTVNANAYTPSTMDAKLDSLIQPITASAVAATAAKAARAAMKAAAPDARVFASGMTAALKGNFGANNPILEDFGIALPKAPVKLTAEQKVAKVAKANHTRQLRGTKGARQKAAVKSNAAFDVSTVSAPIPGTLPAGASAPAATPAVANAVPPGHPVTPAAGGGQ